MRELFFLWKKFIFSTFGSVVLLTVSGVMGFNAGRPACAEPLRVDLARACELALGNDNGIKAAESDVAKANEERRQAHRSRGVTLKIEHNSVRVHYQNENDIDVNSFQNTISATYPLYTGGLIESSIAASEHELRSTLLSLERTRQNVRLSVANAFYTMLRTEDMAKLAGDAVKRLEEHVRNVSAQHRNGKVSKADLLRSEVELINARQQMSQAEKEHSVAIKTLNNAMGISIDTELSYNGKMVHVPFGRTLEECLEYALSRHPNLGIAKTLEAKAKAGIAAAKSEKKPTVSLAVSQALLSTQNWPGIDDDNFQIALHGEYTFSDAGVVSAKIRSAKEDLKKAGYNSESARDSIVLDVTRCFIDVEEAGRRIETGLDALDKAQETYRISLARYREGVGTNIDVLDAQTALNQANSNYTQALCDYNIALARIENAMGVPVAENMNR
ncbi:MAG: TolC family protein [Synergistaceae bacterium]|jgi:outer membrane protein TolC|nr:TolC family protein [Synergistaceae bacterium]